MNDDVTDDRFDAELARFLERRAADVGGVRGASEMIRAIAGVPALGAAGQRRTTRLAWIAVALALALIAASLAFVGSQRRDDLVVVPPVVASPYASLRPSPASTAAAVVVPSASTDPDHFRSMTSLGTIDWTKVVARDPIQPVRSTGGQFLGRDEAGDWWISTDAITWTRTIAPSDDPAEYVPGSERTLVVDSPDRASNRTPFDLGYRLVDRHWFDEPGDAGIRRKVGTELVDLPLPASRPTETLGLKVQGPIIGGEVAIDGSNWIAPVHYVIEVPWDQIYGTYPSDTTEDLQVDPWRLWNPNTQQLEIIIPGRKGILASLTVDLVEGDRPSIEFRDAQTGDLVHRLSASLPGWDAEALLTAFRGWGLNYDSLLVSRNGIISVVHQPWVADEDDGSVLTAFGSYYTVAPISREAATASAVGLWTSDDGLAWRRMYLPSVQAEPPVAALGGGNDRLYLSVDERNGSRTDWTTTDGLTWSRLEHTGGALALALRTDFGWLVEGLPGEAALSADGQTWEQIDLPTLTVEDSVGYLDGGLFVMGPRWMVGSGPYVSWIGRLVR